MLTAIGVVPKIMDKFVRPIDLPSTTIIVTQSTASDRSNVRKGFDATTHSPLFQSPAVSGRNTPEQRTLKETRNVQQMYEKERGDDKDYIHMVVIGHVDAGKSTLMGHTLFDLGDVPQRMMHKYEQESKKMGKQSFMYAWVLDETGEERERGITMDVGSTRFATATKMVIILFLNYTLNNLIFFFVRLHF